MQKIIVSWKHRIINIFVLWTSLPSLLSVTIIAICRRKLKVQVNFVQVFKYNVNMTFNILNASVIRLYNLRYDSDSVCTLLGLNYGFVDNLQKPTSL